MVLKGIVIAAIVVGVVVAVAAIIVGVLIALKVIEIQPAATQPAATQPAATQPLVSAYIDRGFWKDGGFPAGTSDNYQIDSFYNHAVGSMSGINMVDLSQYPELTTNKAKFQFAEQRAIAGNYDTFAFYNGSILFLGNYMVDTVATNGIKYKYDKYGAAQGEYDYGGDMTTIHVFSKVSPNTYVTPTANFQDVGCWNDKADRTISPFWIDMNNTGLARAEWYKYALDLASQGGYDTFGFQADFALFLGNYSPVYRYDKLGPVTPCTEFGGGWINHVYSTVKPNTV